MIEQNKYLPSQMTGPVVNSVMKALDDELSDADTIINYLYNLSIANAQETELESIGCIIGYPRPLVPDGFNQENLLLLGTLPITTDPEIGLSSVGENYGGLLTSIGSDSGNYMSLGMYRDFLQKISYIKRYGLTLKSIDSIAALVSTDYELIIEENSDITIAYNTAIGYKNLWILTQLFRRIATIPQVLITSE